MRRRVVYYYFSRIGIYKVFTIFCILFILFVTLKSFNDGSKSHLTTWPLMTREKKSDDEIKLDETESLKSEISSNSINNSKYRKSCPLCLGTTICDNFEMGAFKVSSKKYNQRSKTVYEGMWHKSSKVLLKITDQDHWNMFKMFVCQNMTKDNDCNELKQKTFFSNKLFDESAIRNIYTVPSQKKLNISPVICATEKMIARFKSVYDFNNDGKFSDSEKLMLYSSLAVDPEAFMHLFLSKSSIDLPVPHFYGVCGHTLVIEGSLMPLIDHIHENFNIRAAFAYQILQIVEDFLEEDADWLFIFSDIDFHNLVVKEDGDVVISDVSNIAMIDKSVVIPSNEKHDKPCNEACFRLQFSNLYKTKNVNQACSKMAEISHMMYALVCKNIFLNVNNMKSVEKNSKPVGLLHSMPSKDKMVLTELLEECVEETSSGGRVQAAEELKDILSEYVTDDNKGGNEEEDDEDDDEKDYPNLNNDGP